MFGRSIIMSGSSLLALLNKKELFTNQDLKEAVDILENDPQAAAAIGSHSRSTIWICAQHSKCPYRSKILPYLLVLHGADVNKKAGNGNTPLHSLYTAWKRQNGDENHHKREMAVVLTQVCRAMVPYDDRNGAPSDIQQWLSEPQLNFEVLE
mmetsp:Transcript_47337/g.54671  ORF Transcript_47337/g.54671 Transcript_47337/m.54671 type:complete len:152 (-) Transcript_47337:114-569(-)